MKAIYYNPDDDDSDMDPLDMTEDSLFDKEVPIR